MPITNEEIGKRMVAAKVFDFKAIGNLVTELAPELVASGTGQRIFVIGKHIFVACILPPVAESGERVGVLGNLAISEVLKE